MSRSLRACVACFASRVRSGGRSDIVGSSGIPGFRRSRRNGRDEASCRIAAMSEEKTEQPTDKKLRDARKDGDTSKSTDLVEAVTMVAVLGVLVLGAGAFAGACRAIVDAALNFMRGDRALTELYASLLSIGTRFVTIVGPCVVFAGIGAVAGLAPQVGFEIATKPVVPDPNRLNVVEGLKR